MNYLIALLIIVLVAAVIYLYLQVRSLKTDLNFLEIDIKGQLMAGLNNLGNATPRAKINKKNEAVITLPDGTEIYNYDLKKNKQ